jgi:hypothetical protein
MFDSLKKIKNNLHQVKNGGSQGRVWGMGLAPIKKTA